MPAPWLARLQTPEQPTLPEVAIRLADEGVPLCAIARTIQIPSSELREHLQAAHKTGRLIDLPVHDWLPHDAKPRRVLAEDRDQQAVAIRTICGATKSEASLLLDLLRTDSICKSRYPSPGAIDVHVFHLRRRLAPHDIAIISVHGHGYRLSPEDRGRLQVMIEQARAA
jgi:hypothetical protein